MKKKKYNYLAAAEKSEEGNYNMIDGIINNTPKPSVMEKIREYEQRIAKNVDGDSNGDEPKKCCPSKGEL